MSTTPSNPLSDARDRLRKLLADAGFNAFTTTPQPATPPFAYVGPDEPYLDYETAGYGGAVIARFQVGYVAAPGDNEVRAAEIDEAVIKILVALQENPEEPHGFIVADVGRPGTLTIASQGGHYAVPISVITELNL